MSVVEIQGVTKRFGETLALDGVDLRIEEGELFALLGPSGSGKTTLLRAIAGFVDPEAGTVRIDGDAMHNLPVHRRDIGMVFQHYALFPHMSVFDNVAFGLTVRHLARSEVAERVRDMLALVQLEGFEDRRPRQLSGGQQQRVALARAIAPEPVVVLMDEPFSNLDAHLRDNVRDEVVRSLRAAGVTCILVSHDQRDALAVSDRVAVMNQGRIEQVGTPLEIYKHPESIFVATFVGRTNLLQGLIQGVDGCVLTDFGTFCRVDRSGLPDGAPVMVSVRPEGFAPSDHGLLRGSVTSTTYTGSAVEVEVQLPTEAGGHRTITVHLPTTESYGTGDEIQLGIVPDYASVVRNSCQLLGFSPQSSE